MNFKKSLFDWIDDSTPNALPDGVVAFSFNLTQVYSEEFEIELVGTEVFDESDEDWACEEIWEPSQRSLEIPKGELGTNWMEVLEGSKNLLMEYLNTGSKAAVLKDSKGIGIGFVDGNLEILWKKN